MKREVIIACDFKCREELFDFLKNFKEEKPFLKIGMELFYKEGPNLIKELKGEGAKIFLDLKLHDIPNTVYKAMKNIASLNVDITNVHSAGGIEMMRAGLNGIIEGSKEKRPLLIAVTQLTSISQEILNKELLISGDINDVVKAYAENTKAAGLDGVVCSPLEAPIIKEMGLISVTPGIRFEDGAAGDQKRIATPAIAKELGSDFIVVGRPITASGSPLEAYKKCVKEFY